MFVCVCACIVHFFCFVFRAGFVTRQCVLSRCDGHQDSRRISRRVPCSTDNPFLNVQETCSNAVPYRVTISHCFVNRLTPW
uniref:Secreted protein n=1 Tax=Ixodes ricinus TaxID=34613 RepID=A0A6B0U6M9_IXORI